jgi:hypothetical protein
MKLERIMLPEKFNFINAIVLGIAGRVGNVECIMFHMIGAAYKFFFVDKSIKSTVGPENGKQLKRASLLCAGIFPLAYEKIIVNCK